MNTSLSAFLALVFVGALGIVLIQPVLDAVDTAPTTAASRPAKQRGAGDRPSPPAEPSAEPQATPAPTPSTAAPAAISGPFRRTELAARLPRVCFASTGRITEPGDVAVGTGRSVTVGAISGQVSTTRRAGSVIGFNASGREIALLERLKKLFLASSDAMGFRARSDIRAWAWSPIGECGFGIDDGGTLFAETAAGDRVVLVAEGVRTFIVSPDGRRLGLVLEEGPTTSVWIADLAAEVMHEVQRDPARRRLALEAWSSDGRALYLSSGRGDGFSFVTTGRRPREGGIVAVPVRNLELCGSRLLGIVNGAVAEISLRGPDYLTDTQAGYSAVSCSPEGGFMAAIRSGRLVLLNADGSFVRDLATDRGYRDTFVEWGPRGAGVVFGRTRANAKRTEVWYIPEGGTARNTGLTYSARGSIDWSATPPAGLPTRWGG